MLKEIKKDDELINLILFAKNNNFKIAVASNSIKQTINTILANLGILDLIDLVIGNDDVKNPKPHPEMYWKCMSHFNTIPDRTVIFEDSIIGKLAVNDSKSNLIEIKNRKDLDKDKINTAIQIVNKTSVSSINKNLNIVIPMAGLGSRFLNSNYTFPKPLIDVLGKSMIETVINNIAIDANYIFIVQKEHYEKYNLEDMLNLISPNCKIIQTDTVLSGAAQTTMLAKEYINNDNPIIIANSDQYVNWDPREFIYDVMIKDVDGAILLFNSTHPKWSYVKINDFGFISEVAEKRVISNNATVGIYYWKHGSDYIKYAEQMIEKDIKVNNEFYVCPVYNEAILDNKKIYPFFVNKMWGLGTPEDLDLFLKEIKK